MSPFAANPDKAPADVRVMWSEGPSREQRSAEDFGGRYVCQACGTPVAGIYRVKLGRQLIPKWVCAACRGNNASSTAD